MSVFLEAFSDTEISMRHREAYSTAPLNSKFYANTAKGIYRGFNIAAEGVLDNTITVEADPILGDHALVYDNSSGVTLTVRRDTGDFNIDLADRVSASEFTGWTLAVSVRYARGTSTSAELRLYQTFPENELLDTPGFEDLLILGSVVLPPSNSSPLTQNNILINRRTLPWENIAIGAQEKFSQIRNSSFVLGTGQDIPYWTLGSGFAKGLGAYLEFTGGTDPINSSVVQSIGTEVVPGSEVRAKLNYDVINSPISGGIYANLMFLTPSGEKLVKTKALDLSTTGAKFLDFSTFVPSNAVILDCIEIVVSEGVWSESGVVLTVTNVTAHVQGLTPARSRGDLESTSLRLRGPREGVATDVDANFYRMRLSVLDSEELNYHTLWESKNTTTPEYARIIRGPGGATYHTLGAKYDNNTGTWVRDSTFGAGFLLGDSGSEFKLVQSESSLAAWEDWETAAAYDTGTGSYTLQGEESDPRAIYGGYQKGHTFIPGFQYGQTLQSLYTIYEPSDVVKSRYHIDWMGLPPGQLRRLDAPWHVSPGSGPTEDPAWLEIGGPVSVDTDLWLGRALELTAVSGNINMASRRYIDFTQAHQQVAFSLFWQCAVEHITDVAPVFMGMVNDSLFLGHKGYWFEYDPVSQPNILASSGGAGSTTETTDTGIAPVAGQPMSMRLDYTGDHLGGYRSVFYIDGAQVADHSDISARVADTQLRVAFAGNNFNGSSLFISPVTMMWYLYDKNSINGNVRWDSENH